MLCIFFHFSSSSGYQQSGAVLNDGSSGIHIKPTLLVTGKVPTNVSASSASDVYRSIRSEISELKPNDYDIPIERSPACVVPSPIHPRPLEMVVGLLRYLLIICVQFIFLTCNVFLVLCSDRAPNALGSCQSAMFSPLNRGHGATLVPGHQNEQNAPLPSLSCTNEDFP
ncbi:hypothetical protein GIB67_041404 [Kingdonia uniflora]|uniref:Uncharacterized protein n=1 Tax=Kingdonia uniflora TaxID=39325 RepID=A0A7J7LRK7_9MAGN|nr:hypothetical protein GIB67_041404 [Kingdonia uniflora]